MSCPSVRLPAMIILAPIHEISRMQEYMENCITGEFRARSFSALTNRPRIFSLSFSNRPVSYSSRTKDFTTRIPFTFSCTLAFSSSYSWNTRLKVGFALDEIRASTAARQTITTRKIRAKRGWIRNVVTVQITVELLLQTPFLFSGGGTHPFTGVFDHGDAFLNTEHAAVQA